jgi:hypothetical protein
VIKHEFKLEVERFYLKSVLYSIFHSILFQRTFGLLIPKEETIKELNSTFPYFPSNETFVREKTEEIIKFIDSQKSQKFQISMKMMQKHRQIEWEEFLILLTVTRARNEKEQLLLHSNLKQSLPKLLKCLCLECLQDTAHLPPIVDEKPFPVDVK